MIRKCIIQGFLDLIRQFPRTRDLREDAFVMGLDVGLSLKARFLEIGKPGLGGKGVSHIRFV